jgi:lipopolysaccharide export system permease protein
LIMRHPATRFRLSLRVPFALPLLDRLLLREAVAPLLVGLFAILQLLVLGQLLQLNEVVFSGAVTLADLSRVTLGLAPHFLVMAAPIAYVLGMQLAVGRLAADRELLALAAVGRSPFSLYRVPIFVALVFGLGTAALVKFAEPQGLTLLNRVLDEMLSRNLETGLSPGVFNDPIPRMMIYFEGKADGAGAQPKAQWLGVLFQDDAEQDGPLLAFAEAGTLERQGDSLALELGRGELHRNELRHGEHGAEVVGETLAQFTSARIALDVREWLLNKNRFATNEAALPADALESRATAMEAAGRHDLAQRARLDSVRRAVAPLACFFFALLAVPLAAWSGGARGSAYLTTLLVFASYFALSRAGVALAERGAPVLLAALLPDLPAALLGAGLSLRFLRRGPGAVRG